MIAGPEQKTLSSSTRAFLWFTSREVLRVARENEEEGRTTGSLSTLERLVGKLLSEGLHDLESAEEKELLHRLFLAARGLAQGIARDIVQLLQVPSWLPEMTDKRSPKQGAAAGRGGRMT